MTPAILRAAGEALYGPLWQCELARALGVTDRTVRRWLQGSRGIPLGLASDLVELLSKRQVEIADVISACTPATLTARNR